MRKFFALVCFMVMVGLWASEGVLLELKPSIDGKVSEYRVVKDLPTKSESHILQKGSRHIDSANYTIQYDSENWVYYVPRPCEDSMVVRFVPPVNCFLVAFTWIGYNDQTGATGQPVGVFAAMANPSEDYSTYPGVDEYHTAPLVHPLGNILWSGTTSAPGNMVWDTVNIDPGVYVGDSTFFCGYSGINPTDTIACLAESWIPMPAVIDVHSYQFNADAFAVDSGAWFCYYYTGDDEALQFGIRAYIRTGDGDSPPVIRAEELPYSYNTGARTVNIYGQDFSPDSCAVVRVDLHYSINSGSWDTLVSTVPVSGTVEEGIWQIDIPGVNVGDTVDYYVVGWDCDISTPLLSDTTPTYTYTILAGTPGHFLYVDNDYTNATALPDLYLDIIDVWDHGTYGSPDSSVLCFYANGVGDTSKTVVWRDWGCTALGRGANYGLGGDGILHPDSAWIKLLLDNGGHFWLSDEDQGYGLGICPNYLQQSVPGGHWVREYLGIQGMYDDNPALAGKGTILYGDPTDPVIGDLFGGIGYQTSGQVYIAPYAPITGNLNSAYVGNYDSLQPGAVMNMFDVAGLIPSYRYEGPSVTYKVYNDFWPFDYICNPADSMEIDEVAVDSLVQDVLLWFNVTSGVTDNTLEPGKVVELLPVNPVIRDAMIRFS
ncbi:hypothetical protein KAW48_04775, partial [candidate division WOR-3 bacterium]|nr:hypothetical protein [candidate division WOR-3 bacterium]